MRPERHPQPLEVIGGVQRGIPPLPGFQGCPLIPENTPRAGGWESLHAAGGKSAHVAAITPTPPARTGHRWLLPFGNRACKLTAGVQWGQPRAHCRGYIHMAEIPEELTASLGDIRVPPDMVQPVNAFWSALDEDERRAFLRRVEHIPDPLERVTFLVKTATPFLLTKD